MKFPIRFCVIFSISGIFIVSLIKLSEASVRRYTTKQVFLKILQNSHENTCGEVSFSCEFCKVFKHANHLKTLVHHGCIKPVLYVHGFKDQKKFLIQRSS